MSALERDDATISRPANTSDAEGNAVGTLTQVFAGRGSFGSVSTTDDLVAAQRGQRIDAVFAVKASGAKPGDFLTVKGKTFEVVSVRDVHIHDRLFLRRVEG